MIEIRNMYKSWSRLAASLALTGLGLTAAHSVQVLQGPPTTAQQGTVPAPKGKIPDANHPLRTSPTIQEVEQMVSGRTLTIDDAVAVALVTNRAFATAAANLERASGRTGEARSALNPKAGLNGTLTDYNSATTANFGGNSLTLTNQFNPVYAATISLPLDISGASHAAVSQAQFNEVGARIDVNRVRNEIVFAVRNAFYQVLRSQGQLLVAQDNLRNGTQRLSDTQKSFEAGIASKFDVLTVQRDVSDAQQNVVNAQAQIILSLASLKNAMGIDISAPIAVSDAGAVEEPAGIDRNAPASTDADALAKASQDLLVLGPEYDNAVKEALQTRPEVLESDAAISAAERGIRFARRSSLPEIAISANYVNQPNAAGFTPKNQSNIALTINVPIFDGGLARARGKEAQADLASAQVSRRSALDQVTLEVQQAYVTLAQARTKVQVATVGQTQAEEAFRLARVRYTAGVTQQQGVSPQLELGNAQAALAQAELNRLNALYDYNLARSQLDRAIGRYSYGEGPGYKAPPTPNITGQPRGK